MFANRADYVSEPVRNTSTVSSEPTPSWSSSDDDRQPSWQSSEKRPSRVSASHVPAWYKDMQKGVEVPVQKIEEPESYIVQKRPSYGKYTCNDVSMFSINYLIVDGKHIFSSICRT